MPYDWGPHYIVPTEVIKSYSGNVLLREDYDAELLEKTLRELGIQGTIARVNNPWYFRRKGDDTWIKIGESQDESSNYAVRWDTRALSNGQYEILGLMHVTVRNGGTEKTIARENVIEVTVDN